MAKKIEYFSHDTNARNDGKLVKLLMDEGLKGIGLYWCLVEMLYENGGYIMRSECERIAFELRIRVSFIEKVVSNYGLFIENEGRIYSQSALDRIEQIHKKSNKARESANSKWEKMRTHSERTANAQRTQSEGNAIKEKESNENKILRERNSDELRNSQQLKESICILNKIDMKKCNELLEIFITRTSGTEEMYRPIGEILKHFRDWVPQYLKLPMLEKALNQVPGRKQIFVKGKSE